MLYIRKLFKQDLRNGKQIAFPKEPSLSFFSFDYINNEEDRKINFTFKAAFNEFEAYDGKIISTRLYSAGSEARMDGEVKAFIRDELNAKINDLLIFKNKGTNLTDFEVMFLPQNNPFYSIFLKLTNSENHTVCTVEDDNKDIDNEVIPLQIIYFGAPGTGKSHKIKKEVDEKKLPCIRTTFHPDSDYSTFVGAYKPTTVDAPVMTMIGTKAVPTENPDGTVRKEKKIVYKFVPQAFLKAYTAAWKNQDKPFYLVIEEINRGNCAQIFGDLFQLLDRNDEGYSDYEISPDEDIQLFLQTDEKFGFAALTDEQKEAIPEKILTGEIMKLPNNLHIWATMNTSDQSLFPIDSAFKRRWDWEYLPIYNAKKGWKIKVKNKLYGWWNFLELMNDKIGSTTNSEDKKLGYFFCKPQNDIIDAKTFVGKVIFYIWNDVFKDFAEEAGDLFKDVDGKLLSFDKFYVVGTDGQTVVNETNVELFLQHLGVLPVTELESEDEDEEEDDDSGTTDGKDYSRYTINGEGSFPKRQLSTQAVQKYIDLHPGLSPQEVVNNWMSLGNIVSHFVETKEQFEARTDNSKRSHEVPCGDSSIYVAWNGWGKEDKMKTLIEAVNKQNWGITLAKIEE